MSAKIKTWQERLGLDGYQKPLSATQTAMCSEIAELRAALAAQAAPAQDARDAARYRWLTERPGFIRPHLNGQAVYVNWSGTRAALGEAIDAAVAASTTTEKGQQS